MIVIIDGGKPKEVLNSVKVIIGDGKELHINITHEGTITDVIDGGEVVQSRSVEHEFFHFFEEENDWTKGEEE